MAWRVIHLFIYITGVIHVLSYFSLLNSNESAEPLPQSLRYLVQKGQTLCLQL